MRGKQEVLMPDEGQFKSIVMQMGEILAVLKHCISRKETFGKPF
jgi:hypothetical protein